MSSTQIQTERGLGMSSISSQTELSAFPVRTLTNTLSQTELSSFPERTLTNTLSQTDVAYPDHYISEIIESGDRSKIQKLYSEEVIAHVREWEGEQTGQGPLEIKDYLFMCHGYYLFRLDLGPLRGIRNWLNLFNPSQPATATETSETIVNSPTESLDVLITPDDSFSQAGGSTGGVSAAPTDTTPIPIPYRGIGSPGSTVSATPTDSTPIPIPYRGILDELESVITDTYI